MSVPSLQTNNTAALCWNHPKLCNMAISRGEVALSNHCQILQGWGFMKGCWKPALARGIPLLRGKPSNLRHKNNLGTPFPWNMKPAYVFLPLSHWCCLTETTEVGTVGFFLDLKVCTTPLSLCLNTNRRPGPQHADTGLLPWDSALWRPFCPHVQLQNGALSGAHRVVPWVGRSWAVNFPPLFWLFSVLHSQIKLVWRLAACTDSLSLVISFSLNYWTLHCFCTAASCLPSSSSIQTLNLNLHLKYHYHWHNSINRQ